MGTPLDEVLSGAVSAPAVESQPQQQEPQQAIEQPQAQQPTTGEPQTQTPPAEAAGTGAESGGATPAQEPGTMVPLKALEEERKGRQDWKEKAIRFEEELKHLRSSPQQSQTQQQPQQAAPLTYEQALLNERMNMSEMMVRQQHGDEKISEALATFQAAVAKNPALGAELAQQRHPWQWMYDQATRMKALEEIGSDPAAYRERIRAEIEAELKAAHPAAETEQSVAAAPAAAAPVLPKSLATTRSAAPRSAPVWTGPTSLNDILKR